MILFYLMLGQFRSHMSIVYLHVRITKTGHLLAISHLPESTKVQLSNVIKLNSTYMNVFHYTHYFSDWYGIMGGCICSGRNSYNLYDDGELNPSH